MTRATVIAWSAMALVFSVHVTPVHAQHGSAKPRPVTSSQHGSPKPATTQHGSPKPATTSHGSTASHGSSAAQTHGAKAKVTAPQASSPKTKPAASGKSAKTSTSSESSSKLASKSSKSAPASTSTSATSTSSTSTASTTTLTPVQQKLLKNTNLASKLQSRLPAGTNVQEAAAGFRNLGQFVAAVNVSKNLNIPFDKLKANMVTKNMSLGQSIQQLKPASSATVEAQHAEYEANVLIAQTPETATTSTTSPTVTAKKKTSRQ